MKKNIILLALISGISISLEGQTDSVKNPEQFMFPKFSVGVVKLKTGEKIPLKLNYNVVTEKMVFFQNNQVFDMTDYETVDTIYIQRRKFVPVNRVFYETLVNGPVSLFIQHRATVIQPSRPAAYGGTSQVSSSTYINNLSFGSETFRMKNNQEIGVEPDPMIWIRKDNTMHPVINKTGLLSIFPENRNVVSDFIRQNDLNTENPDHLIKLVRYYNGLPR
jgi:hypothetical protein